MSSVTSPLRLSWAQVNDIGMRAENQDNLGVARHADLACFVVADGTGGYAGGATASKLVVDTLLAAFRAAPACDTGALRAAIGTASANVARARRADPAYAEMSSTVAALVVDAAAARAVWAHLGDTRVYLFRANRLHSVTVDHSLARQLIDSGYGGHVTLRGHPQRNILLGAIGAENDIAVSTSEGAFALLPGDALLLCSDGLWEWIDEAQMEAVLAVTSQSEEWLDLMCEVADTAASATIKIRDNFSACAIRVHAADGQT
jgi:serine/threonine protein phosphatase PrpC